MTILSGAILVGLAGASGCASGLGRASHGQDGRSAAVSQTVSEYCISDGAQITRTCELDGRTMLSAVLTDIPKASRAGGTVVLVRRGPEGMTRNVIPLNAAGRLADPASDRVLRDGDKIVVPIREPSPLGLSRPTEARGTMN